MVARASQEYGSPALPLWWRLTGRESTLGGRRSYRPTMDTLTELRQLADDLTDLGDSATAALVRQAIDRFMAWKFEAGERLLQCSRCSPSPCAPVAIRHYYAPMLKAHWKGSR